MKLTHTLKFVLLLLAAGPALAQSPTPLTAASYVTEIVTDYGGYWRSGNGTAPNAALSGTKPDNSHQLLAFVVNSGITTVNGNTFALTRKYFSTGIDDALLASKGLPYTASRYQALSVGALSGTVTTNTKVGLGQLFDRVDNGPGSPAPASGYAQYLVDGTQGLDLGTGVANLPAGTLTFTVSDLSAAAIGDGVPDILITQVASPSSVVDSYRFLDASGAQVAGTVALSANFSGVNPVGRWTADFYEAAQNPMTLTAGFTKTDRDLRLLAVDLSAFGITSANLNDIKQFQIALSGDSDQAFIAYNSNAATLSPLPVTLVSFTGRARGTAVQLAWQTASELHSDFFEVQASPDGQTFAAVGRVAAAGTTQQTRRYQFEYLPATGGRRYYRLRQVDLDGAAHYSPTIAVNTGAAAVEVFPGVFDDQLTVQLPATGPATITLLATDGRVLRQQPVPASTEGQRVAVPGLAALPPGLYLLHTVVEGQPAVRRVVKL